MFNSMSYIQSHIDFCNIVRGNSCESNKMKIFRLQKHACRVILDYKDENTHEALSSLKILSIYDCLLRNELHFSEVYSSVNYTGRMQSE